MIRSSSSSRAAASGCGGPGAVALVQPHAAQLRETPHRVGVLRARVAVAEVARQVEAQLLGEAHALAHRLGVLGEARRHRRGGGQHVAVVATPQRLAGVERGAVAQRHEGVLQLRATARVGVHVAARHARHPEAPGERLQRAVARAIVAGVGALQLHAQAVRAEGVQQPPRGGLVVHAAGGASREAHQPLAVLPHRLQAHRRLAPLAAPGPLARVGVRQSQQPAEVAPAARVAHQQRQVAGAAARAITGAGVGTGRGASRVTTALIEPTVHGHVDLGTVDRAYPVRRGRLCQLHRA